MICEECGGYGVLEGADWEDFYCKACSGSGNYSEDGIIMDFRTFKNLYHASRYLTNGIMMNYSREGNEELFVASMEVQRILNQLTENETDERQKPLPFPTEDSK